MANYRKHSREQIEMKMMCINDFVPTDHEARVIVSIIETLDLSAFDEYFNNDTGGNKAYPILSLLSILAYAFFEGISSTRLIEQNCYENISEMEKEIINEKIEKQKNLKNRIEKD